MPMPVLAIVNGSLVTETPASHKVAELLTLVPALVVPRANGLPMDNVPLAIIIGPVNELEAESDMKPAPVFVMVAEPLTVAGTSSEAVEDGAGLTTNVQVLELT